METRLALNLYQNNIRQSLNLSGLLVSAHNTNYAVHRLLL